MTRPPCYLVKWAFSRLIRWAWGRRSRSRRFWNYHTLDEANFSTVLMRLLGIVCFFYSFVRHLKDFCFFFRKTQQSYVAIQEGPTEHHSTSGSTKIKENFSFFPNCYPPLAAMFNLVGILFLSSRKTDVYENVCQSYFLKIRKIFLGAFFAIFKERCFQGHLFVVGCYLT